MNFYSLLFHIIIRARHKQGGRQIVLIAPHSIDKRAVVRNRLRRRAREWLRRRPELLENKELVIIFKKEAVAAPRKKFYEELDRAFSGIRRRIAYR